MTAILDVPEVESKTLRLREENDRWLVFVYAPAALFSLKASWATSTAGITLLTPTPYAVKMAFLDAALRGGLAASPESFVRELARVTLRIGLPGHACVTESIQRIRQETRDPNKRDELPPYRSNVALRQMVHYQGDLRFAFELATCSDEVATLLAQTAPAINYVGKRGSFLQYIDAIRVDALDESYTATFEDEAGAWGHRAMLDDFGPKASFDALNSYSTTEIKRGVHRKFVDTVVPLGVRNSGPGFVHYSAARNATL
jgi:hypothetical protein